MDTDFIKHLSEDFTQDFRFSFEGVDDPAQYLKDELGVSIEDVSGTVTLGRDQIRGMEGSPGDWGFQSFLEMALLPSDFGKRVIEIQVIKGRALADGVVVDELVAVNGKERDISFAGGEGSSDLTDLGSLSGMPTLTRLSLFYCQELRDISGLSALRELRELCLHQTHNVEDLAPIAHLNKLELLDLDHAQVNLDSGARNLDFLQEAPNLRWLNLTGNIWLRDLRGLEALPHLEELYLGITGFPKEVDFKPIQRLRSLRRLQLGGAEFESLDFLKGLEHLEWLEFDLPTSRLTDLSALSELGSLQEVHFDFDLEANPRDIDVSPLAQCPALRLVGLSQDPIEAIAGVDVLRERGDIEIVTSTED